MARPKMTFYRILEKRISAAQGTHKVLTDLCFRQRRIIFRHVEVLAAENTF